MRRLVTTIVLALTTLSLALFVSAQQAASNSVPNLIRYSGTLKDAQGAPLTSSTAMGVTFAIYKQQEGGAAVWQETQNVTPDSSGQYNVVLGSTTATGLPDDLFSQQEQRWLGVQIQGEAEQARVMLVSVPYAFKAHEADTLGGLPASAFAQIAPSKQSSGGSTETEPGLTALPSGASTAKTGTALTPRNSPATVSNCAASSAGYLSFFLSPTVLCNSAIYQFPSVNPLVGVGTTNPLAKLSVNGNISTNLQSQSYQIAYFTVLSAPGTGNVFVGNAAGASDAAGFDNTFSGVLAGNQNTGGTYNTYSGAQAGDMGTTGSANTFTGFESGFSNTASNNSFYGYQAGLSNNSATGNAFFGYQAGLNNTTGDGDTFTGYQAGNSNLTGPSNTFTGYQAGYANVAGNNNTFTGYQAGYNATDRQNTFDGYQAGYGASDAGPNTGMNNTYSGFEAGAFNTSGSDNVFVGFFTGNSNTSGGNNTYVGESAGQRDSVGSGNIDIGNQAGINSTTGGEDIYIGSQGALTNSGESQTIRIGNDQVGGFPQQHAVYIAGLVGVTAGDSHICVVTNPLQSNIGQLGICNPPLSSRRFKTQILDMDDSSNKLLQLRPVTFFYKPEYDDGAHALQYGLIAEEVAKVYPEMVTYDKEGQPYTVKYQLLAPMLLNELQKEHTVVMAQQEQLGTQLQQIKAQRQEIETLRLQVQQENASLRLQNAAMQERLTKLESYVATQVKVASEVSTATSPSANGDMR